MTFVSQDCDYPHRKGSSSDLGAMPFPPGVGGGRASSDAVNNSPSYEVITADRAIDESNVGNRMLRNMGWQEGLVSPLSFPGFFILSSTDYSCFLFACKSSMPACFAWYSFIGNIIC